MKRKFPKVLIITSRFLNDESNQTAITMKSYFEMWPEENIAQIITGQFNISKNDSLNKNAFILNNDDIKVMRHLFKINRTPANTSVDKNHSTIAKRESFKGKIKSSIKRILISTTNFFKYETSPELMSFIKNFSPDIIYYLPSGYRVMKLVNDISNKLNIKYVLHFMDDWQSTIYDSPDTRLHEKLMCNYIKKSISNASACLCISDYMSREYEKRYNIDKCYTLMNSVDRYYGDNSLPNNNKNVRLRIVYFGRISDQRALIIKQVHNSLVMNHFPPFDLVIYTSKAMWEDYKTLYADCPNIQFGGFLSREEVFEHMLNSDILLHVESFDAKIRKFTRFSMSTKIPEYLSTGKIILAVGPPEIASIKYLEENEAAITITDLSNKNQIKNQIKQITDTEHSTLILENAKKLFYKNHLKSKQILLPLLQDLTGA